MNYRHAFHAGNFADVFKHTILTGLLQGLKLKPTPFCYFDTHAGAGCYDLRSKAAMKTGEARDGVQRLLQRSGQSKEARSTLLRDYVELVKATTGASSEPGLVTYPGSPLIAARLMRAADRAVLCEVQPDEAAALKALLAGDARIGVHQRDGYAALGALLPPKERRGVVLIDPPFEAQEQEFRAIEAALSVALARWPTGIYAIWYPIKRREATRPFLRWFAAHDVGKTLVAELLVHADDSPLRLNGCGMVIVNAPWKFDVQLVALLEDLRRELAVSGEGHARVDWLTRG